MEKHLDQNVQVEHTDNEFPADDQLTNVTTWDKIDHGDDSRGDIDWTKRQIVAVVSLSGLWVGSQIPLYFTGGMLSYMIKDLGGDSAAVWLPVSNTLVLAAICPFTGYLQDLFGRRLITLVGSLLIMTGIVIVGTAHTFGQAVTGMALAGGGAAIGELTALAGTSELVPVRKRGLYIGLIVCFISPFCPYVLYSQMLCTRTSEGWRWGFWISLMYNFLAFLGIFFFYFPEKNHQALPGPKRDILKKIDYVGAALSIAGATLFRYPGWWNTSPWTSARVLAPLLIGILLMISFIVWSWKFAKQPMIPREIFRGQRAVGMSFVAAFVGGMDFYSLLNFFPLTFQDVFTPSPIAVGIKGLGYGFSVAGGAAFFNYMLSIFPHHNREILIISAVMMTAFGGALATVTPETPALAVALGTICGFGCGGLLVPTQTIAISCSPDAFIATTTALSLAIRVIGGSIGYSIYFNVFSNKLTTALPAQVAEFALGAGLPASSATEFVTIFLTAPANITSVAGVTPAIIAAASKGSQWAFSEALRMVWLVTIPFGVAAIVACCFLGNTGKFMTNRVAAHIKH